MKPLKERIEIEQAGLDGKAIERFIGGETAWWTLSGSADDDFVYDWENQDYRIKAKPLEFWVNVYDDDSYGQGFDTESEARRNRLEDAVKTIKVQEVIE